MPLWKEFRTFALKGNVTTVVRSLVDDVIMPPVSLLVGDRDFSTRFWVLKAGDPDVAPTTPAQAKEAGYVTLNYGQFVNVLLAFAIVAFAIFLLVRAINNARRKDEAVPPKVPTDRPCPFCLQSVPLQASRCPHCTSDLPQVGGSA
jgi:large conductance mechanosensitive channel